MDLSPPELRAIAQATSAYSRELKVLENKNANEKCDSCRRRDAELIEVRRQTWEILVKLLTREGEYVWMGSS